MLKAMKIHAGTRTLYVVLLTGILASCKITKPYSTPEQKTGSLYRTEAAVDSSTIADLPWKELISDSTLQNLISEGLQQNLDLKIAIQRINEAQAALDRSRAMFFPSLEGGVKVANNKSSLAALNFPPGININLNTVTYQALLNSSWEADVWGKLKSGKKAALANFLQSEASARAVQTQLISDIALNYYDLLAYDQQLAITEQTLKNRIEDQQTMKALKDASIVNGAAVVQSEANRYAAEVAIPDLKRNIREAENALAILLAREPGAIERTKLADQRPYTDLAVGVPSQLLRNRPDLQQAEFAFRAAFENTNVARTYFYPALTITASGGLSTLQVKDFFNRSIFYSLIGGVTQPIFSQGANKARLKTSEAQQQQAFYNYQQSWLTAGLEVSNALYLYQTATEKEESRARQIAGLEKSVEFTKDLLQYSSATNYTDVLTSEQTLLAAQLNGVNDRLQKLQSVIQLYRALGGGWK
jgi:multidrug efflux system outer membrane protein